MYKGEGYFSHVFVRGKVHLSQLVASSVVRKLCALSATQAFCPQAHAVCLGALQVGPALA